MQTTIMSFFRSIINYCCPSNDEPNTVVIHMNQEDFIEQFQPPQPEEDEISSEIVQATQGGSTGEMLQRYASTSKADSLLEHHSNKSYHSLNDFQRDMAERASERSVLLQQYGKKYQNGIFLNHFRHFMTDLRQRSPTPIPEENTILGKLTLENMAVDMITEGKEQDAGLIFDYYGVNAAIQEGYKEKSRSRCSSPEEFNLPNQPTNK